MKVHLYAVNHSMDQDGKRNFWRWYVSFEMQVDAQYWFRQRNHPYIVVLKPKLPLGIALEYCKIFHSFARLKYSNQDSKQLTQKWVRFMLLHQEHVQLSENLQKQLSFKFVQAVQYKNHADFNMNSKMESKIIQSIQGRELLQAEFIHVLKRLGYTTEDQWTAIIQHLYLTGQIEIKSGVTMNQKKSFPWLQQQKEMTCHRCGSGREYMYETLCLFCEENCLYCEHCITMGKSRYCTPLIQGKGSSSSHMQSQVLMNKMHPSSDLKHWNLSQPQIEAVRTASAFLNEMKHNITATKPPHFLIWAVTGAGKTEMIFPLIQQEINNGHQVMLATPRKDVVLELQPRLQKAFPHLQIVTLYGGSPQKWEEGNLFIATTHQLLRFWQKFDCIIIDELDAFPFHNNGMLQYAAMKACKPQGRYIMLSATPPAQMVKLIEQGQLPHVKVPVRYHRHPLPIPQRVSFPSLHHICSNDQIEFTSLKGPINKFRVEKGLLQRIRDTMKKEAICFIFLPKIKYINPFVQYLRTKCKDVNVQGVSSIDKQRELKVQAFRNREIQILVTTTILERGVTVPNTDVYIIDADSNMFDEAALVQMAGRAGRSAQYPDGKVYFFSNEKTKSQVVTMKQIKQMNTLAEQKGYLKEEYSR
ncbi:DEAD/DEAH box helicase [Chengkuizengella sediminis]|uniref:DEAD/DEAH box helicase n=1 Tax=Chengkuizengella sediminis TaxID=1885917 RepID=UPI001389DC5D|nr:DEAD/DEAH box helicase [Chengkuizengella sediminis]NDI36528.1 DEAD/DEAH box helicase family protein [Chengkuizengella sediminis]